MDLYASDPIRAVLPPYAGLGLYGGIAGPPWGSRSSCAAAASPLATALDVVVPGTLFAQAIARWGNFFNQELYGPPTDLPWAITIDCAHRIEHYPCGEAWPEATTGFHPLFLYESIWTIGGGLLALVHRRASATVCATATSPRSG